MKPKILIYDIETSAMEALVWQRYDTNTAKVRRESELLSFSYKYLGQKKVYSRARNEYKLDGDKKLCQELHRILSEADIVVAHNGIQFDNKKSFTRFIRHNLPPIPKPVTVDTKRVAKNTFGFSSNSLDDLGVFLGLGRKIKHSGIDLWDRCMHGDKKAFKEMERYNRGDVRLLEKVYNRLKPWTENHPSVAILKDRPGCAVCGSKKMQKRGVSVTNKGKKQRYQCQDCGAWTSKSVKIKK